MNVGQQVLGRRTFGGRASYREVSGNGSLGLSWHRPVAMQISSAETEALRCSEASCRKLAGGQYTCGPPAHQHGEKDASISTGNVGSALGRELAAFREMPGRIEG